MVRIAFVGFRHGHIFSALKHVRENPDAEVVAACEEDEATRLALQKQGDVVVTHSRFQDLLDQDGFDAVAIGDVYARRGALMVEALRRGKHVLSDKPVCTRLEELTEAERLAREKKLSIGCQLDLRDSGLYLRLRELVRGGAVGRVLSILFTGAHPLNLGSRPAWYFEPGRHGGTLNDIGIHAFDLIPWLTGQPFAEVVAARVWNAKAREFPHFGDGAQCMLRLADGCGVMGDVSYFMPEGLRVNTGVYWRLTLFGETGVLETWSGAPAVNLFRKGAEAVDAQPPLPNTSGGYLRSFVAEIQGRPDQVALSTAEVVRASRVALETQRAADAGLAHVVLA